ncbi:MAG: VOC family protein [Acidobacteria bacterium]|nr:VOC family protein [Acidobacteriota bacterium]MBI3264150.1 VOC family protein [Acidobacteriota bacterium]
MALSQIGQIAVTVKDVPRARAFYRDTLGLKFLFDGGERLTFFDAGGVRLMLSIPEPEHDHPSSILYFKVTDIGRHVDALKSRGVTFVGEPHIIARMPTYDLWMAFFTDSEGNTLALYEEAQTK